MPGVPFSAPPGALQRVEKVEKVEGVERVERGGKGECRRIIGEECWELGQGSDWVIRQWDLVLGNEGLGENM